MAIVECRNLTRKITAFIAVLLTASLALCGCRAGEGSGRISEESNDPGTVFASKESGSAGDKVPSSDGESSQEASSDAVRNGSLFMDSPCSIRLKDRVLDGQIRDKSKEGRNWNVIAAGVDKDGLISFSMKGGRIAAAEDGIFYTTDNRSSFQLSGVKIEGSDEDHILLKCTGNAGDSGKSGSNGSDCVFEAACQDMTGNVVFDSISTLKVRLTDKSSLTGALLDDESQAGEGGEGYADLSIDKTSAWILTADSTVRNLRSSGTIKDYDGKTVTIVGRDGKKYAEGDSILSVTVETYGPYEEKE